MWKSITGSILYYFESCRRKFAVLIPSDLTLLSLNFMCQTPDLRVLKDHETVWTADSTKRRYGQLLEINLSFRENRQQNSPVSFSLRSDLANKVGPKQEATSARVAAVGGAGRRWRRLGAQRIIKKNNTKKPPAKNKHNKKSSFYILQSGLVVYFIYFVTMLKLCLHRAVQKLPSGLRVTAPRLPGTPCCLMGTHGRNEPREPLNSPKRAKEFIYRLQPNERTCLLKELQSFESIAIAQGEKQHSSKVDSFCKTEAEVTGLSAPIFFTLLTLADIGLPYILIWLCLVKSLSKGNWGQQFTGFHSSLTSWQWFTVGFLLSSQWVESFFGPQSHLIGHTLIKWW